MNIVNDDDCNCTSLMYNEQWLKQSSPSYLLSKFLLRSRIGVCTVQFIKLSGMHKWNCTHVICGFVNIIFVNIMQHLKFSPLANLSGCRCVKKSFMASLNLGITLFCLKGRARPSKCYKDKNLVNHAMVPRLPWNSEVILWCSHHDQIKCNPIECKVERRQCAWQ